jgi:plasmid replication initiation protein
MSAGPFAVTKSNYLIRASYRLTLAEQRVILCCLAQVDSRKRLQHSHTLEMQTEGLTVTALDYAKLFELDPSTAYRELQQAADRLFNRTITVKKNERGERTRTRWLQGDARAEKGSGYIRLSFTLTLAEHMTQQRGKFTAYQLEQVRHLKRPAAIRLFELMMQWRDTGIVRIKLDDLREMMDMGYKTWADASRYVFRPAIEDINAHTGYTAKLRAIKHGRKVDTVEITFTPNKQQSIEPIGDLLADVTSASVPALCAGTADLDATASTQPERA